jgi:sortase B
MDIRNKKKNLKTAYRILLATAAGIFAISICFLLSYFLESKEEEDAYAEARGSAVIPAENGQVDPETVNTAKPEETSAKLKYGLDIQDGVYYYDPDFTDAYITEGNKDIKKLQEKYPDIAAWLYIPGTNISYPVMGAEDDEYLIKNYKGEQAKSGSLFAYNDELNDPENRNITIYGHNMKNGSMFGSLKAFLLVVGLFEGADKVYLQTTEGVSVYRIFSIYVSPADGSQSDGYFSGGEAYLKYLQDCAEKSVRTHKTQPEFSTDSTVLTLSTCTSLMGAGENDRLIVQAVMQ